MSIRKNDRQDRCAKRLRKHYGLDAGRIVCGNGSDELLTMLAGIYLEPGDEVLFSEHAFLVYKIAALSNSATPVVVPEPNLRVDVDAMLKAVTAERQRMLYLANPEQSDRFVPAARRCAPPACRPVARHAARDRRGLCRNMSSGVTTTNRASRW